MAARHWTPEQRQQQAQRIRQSKPWVHSTGPRSVAGKQASSHNAYKGGLRQELRHFSRMLSELLAAQRRLTAEVLSA